MRDLIAARTELAAGAYTCVLCRDGVMRRATQRGVAPLLAFLEEDTDFHGFCAADKVVGRGAAFLYVLLGVSAVYAEVISEAALSVLQKADVAVEYNALVPYIKNRQGNGPCPIEQATLSIDTASEALPAIRKTLQALRAK